MPENNTLADEINVPGTAEYNGVSYPVAKFTFHEMAVIQRRVGSFEAMDFGMLDVQLIATHLAIQQSKPEVTYHDVCKMFPVNEGADSFAETFTFINRVLVLAGLIADPEEPKSPKDAEPVVVSPSASTLTTENSIASASSPVASRPAKSRK